MATTSIEAPNLFNVNGLVAVITGGGSGIGLMMARALALNGASKIYILGRRSETLESASKSVPTSNIIPLVCDVTSSSSLSSAIATITSQTGYINLLIANSGTLGPQPSRPLTESSTIQDFVEAFKSTPPEEYTATFEINTTAVWYTILGFLELLDRGNQVGNVVQKSQVVVTGSIAAFNRSTPGGFAYGQSKAAVTHLVKQLATRLGQWGVRVNGIAPGLFPSALASPIIGTGIFPKSAIPLERIGTEEDMAGLTLFIASKAGAYCDGNITVMDGGRLGMNPGSY